MRLPLFAFMYRNAVKMVDRFDLPEGGWSRLSRQIEI